jgi:hypothetical protein
MAVTQADIDALDAVVKSGVLTVHFKDRTVTYQSTAEMERTLARMKRELADASSSRASYTLLSSSKGF